jgi:hypothetical protein
MIPLSVLRGFEANRASEARKQSSIPAPLRRSGFGQRRIRLGIRSELRIQDQAPLEKEELEEEEVDR